MQSLKSFPGARESHIPGDVHLQETAEGFIVTILRMNLKSSKIRTLRFTERNIWKDLRKEVWVRKWLNER